MVAVIVITSSNKRVHFQAHIRCSMVFLSHRLILCSESPWSIMIGCGMIETYFSELSLRHSPRYGILVLLSFKKFQPAVLTVISVCVPYECGGVALCIQVQHKGFWRGSCSNFSIFCFYTHHFVNQRSAQVSLGRFIRIASITRIVASNYLFFLLRYVCH